MPEALRPRAEIFYRNWRLTAVLALAATGSGSKSASAAEQGELSVSSRGTVHITASIAANVGVTGLSDSALLPSRLRGSVPIILPVCVSTNAATGLYAIVASGSVVDGNFALHGPGGAAAPIRLDWTDAAATTRTLFPDIPVRDLVAGRTSCRGRANAKLSVAAHERDMLRAGLVTLTFVPL